MLEHRHIFISHTHADRALATALQQVIEEVYSGLVDVFSSTDTRPGVGLQPGDEWFPTLHRALINSESVWVLATEASITRPWIYWEAGIGRALCVGGVNVVRVGLKPADIPGPLNSLQSYDGLSNGDNGMAVMVRKVAAQIGIKPPASLVDAVVMGWIEKAKGHEPDTAHEEESHMQLAPEQVDRIEQIVARLERVSRGALSRRSTTPSAHEWLAYWGGRQLSTLGELYSLITAAPAVCEVSVGGIDDDGDAILHLNTPDAAAVAYLGTAMIERLRNLRAVPPHLRRIVENVRATLDANTSEIDPDELPF